MASPLSSSSDYNIARKLQEKYLANFKKHREEERLSELAARNLEIDIQREAMKSSEQLALQLDQEYKKEERKRNTELELDPDVLTQAMLDSPVIIPRYPRGRERPTRPVESYDHDTFLVLQAMSEESPINWNASVYHTSPQRLSYAAASPISFSTLSSPPARSYSTRSRRHRSSPLPTRAVRRRAGGAEVDVDRMSYEELQRLCERNGEVKDKAAAATAVSRLPTAEVRSPHERASEDNCCSICLEPFKKKQVVKTLPCFHRFHVKEIDKWLKQNNSCPICKQPIDA